MHSQMFAAMDELGTIRFIGDVERGAACGCVCPVCGSPLVAKQGAHNHWHFAHEASQERVECEAGAYNMLRRVAVEMLQGGPIPVLPPYEQHVAAHSKNQLHSNVATWNAQMEPVGLEWDLSGLQSRPALRGLLSTGTPFDVYVVVNHQAPVFPPPVDQDTAHLLFWIETPLNADLLRRISLERHIGHAGRWIWKSHPEYLGLVADARAAAQKEAMASDLAAHQKYVATHNEFQRRLRVMNEEKERREGEWRAQQEAKASNVPDNSVAWAPDRKPSSAFVFYKLREDQGIWVIYQRFDGSHWMVPLPLFEGWDEAMPASVAVAEVEHSAYRLPDVMTTMSYLSQRAQKVRTPTSPSEVVELVQLG